MMSESRVQIIKYLKGNTFDERFIRDFESQWDDVRHNIIPRLDRYERLYRMSEGFKEYVNSYLSHKDVALSDVLCMRTTRMIAGIYAKELGLDLTEPIPDPPKPKRFTIWKE